jgi:two-component system, chemotaxis family, protein-glutamate methylesterase/glutaminase
LARAPTNDQVRSSANSAGTVQLPNGRTRCSLSGGVVIRVLLVDDSVVTRRLLRQLLTSEADIEVVAEAPDPYVARELAMEHRPDVVLLDIEMPGMDGISFLRKLTRYSPTPVVVCSSLSDAGGKLAVEAFDAGAVEVICRPQGAVSEELRADLLCAVRGAAASRRTTLVAARRPVELRTRGAVEVVALGASTGGASVVEAITGRLPAHMPPIVVVQHLPASITKAFAARLNRLSRLEVEEARDGRLLEDGLVLIAPGDRHLEVVRVGRELCCRVSEQPRVNGRRPSVDVLFHSVARACGRMAVAGLLSGLGVDGAQGLRELREAGAHTLVQDERTSAVFGAARAALRLGAARELAALDELAPRLARAVERHATRVSTPSELFRH